MKFAIFAMALILPALAQQSSAKTTSKSSKSTAKAQPKTAEPAPAPYNGPPKGAEKINATDWRWVDKTGKAWIYRRGPITWVREPEAETPAPAPVAANVKATDKGETVEFARSTPMGVTRWSKKKSDLNAEEQAALEATQQEKK